MTDSKEPEESKKASAHALLEALAASFFWGYVAIKLSSIGAWLEAAPTTRFLLSGVLVGNVLAIALAGFLGTKANERHLFLFGFVGALACVSFHALNAFAANPLLAIANEAAECATSFLLVLAWCERTSRKTAEQRPPLLVMCGIGVVVLMLLEQQIDPELTDVLCNALLVASCSATLFLEKHSAPFEAAESTRLPRHVAVMMAAFGLMIGMLSFLGQIMAGSTNALSLDRGDAPLMLWTFFSAVVGIGAYALFSRKTPPPRRSPCFCPLSRSGFFCRRSSMTDSPRRYLRSSPSW